MRLFVSTLCGLDAFTYMYGMEGMQGLFVTVSDIMKHAWNERATTYLLVRVCLLFVLFLCGLYAFTYMRGKEGMIGLFVTVSDS